MLKADQKSKPGFRSGKKAGDVSNGNAAWLSPSATVADLSAQWRIRPDLRLNAGIYNLGDKRYWDYSSTRSLQPGVARDRRDIELLSNPGRTFAVSMNVAF